MFDVCLSHNFLSVAYIGPKSRTERPRKTKIGKEVAHVTCNSNTTFKVKRSKVNLQGAGAYCGGLAHSLFVSMSYSLGWAVLLIVVVSQSRRSISKFRGPCLSAKDINIEVPQVLEYVYIRFNLGIIVFYS